MTTTEKLLRRKDGLRPAHQPYRTDADPSKQHATKATLNRKKRYKRSKHH